MTSRQRLFIALNHRPPDRVPIDLGATPASTLSPAALENLEAHLGIRSRTGIMDPIFGNPHADRELIQRLGIDVKMVSSLPPAGFQVRSAPEGKIRDEWGVVYRKEKTIKVYIEIEAEAPLHGASSRDEIDKYPWPDPGDPSRVRGLREIARKIQEEGMAVIVKTPLTVMTQSQRMRGSEQFLKDIRTNFSFAEYLIDKILEVQMEMGRILLEEVEPFADLVVISDMASEGSSPEIYRKLIQPRERAILHFLKEHAGEAKVLYQGPGAAEPFLKDLVEWGIEAVTLQTPLEVNAAKKIKELYGRDLNFWGGIDIQNLLASGTPGQVRTEVRKIMEAMAPDGGFIFAPTRNLTAGAKAENIWAFFEAAQEFGRYS